MPNPTIPRLPSRPGTVLLGGATIIGGLFAGTWFYMSTKQARKASREPGEKGALSSWEYRMRQTVESPRGGGVVSVSGSQAGPGPGLATAAPQTREPRTLPLDAPNRDPDSDRPQHGTLSPGEEELRSESNLQPYTKQDPAGSQSER